MLCLKHCLFAHYLPLFPLYYGHWGSFGLVFEILCVEILCAKQRLTNKRHIRHLSLKCQEANLAGTFYNWYNFNLTSEQFLFYLNESESVSWVTFLYQLVRTCISESTAVVITLDSEFIQTSLIDHWFYFCFFPHNRDFYLPSTSATSPQLARQRNLRFLISGWRKSRT